MAAVQTEGTVTCPLPGCDYEGSPRSVESHISGKADDVHQGEVGRSYRDALESDGAEDRVEVEVEEVDRRDVESDEDPSESEETDEEEPEEPDPEESEEEEGVPSIPLPMDKTTLVLIVGLVVVLGLLYRQGYFSSDEPVQEETEEETEPVGDAGLIGA